MSTASVSIPQIPMIRSPAIPPLTQISGSWPIYRMNPFLRRVCVSGSCLLLRETREPLPWSRRPRPEFPHRSPLLSQHRVQCPLHPFRKRRSLRRPLHLLRRIDYCLSIISTQLPPPPVDTIPAVPAAHTSRRGKTAAELYSNREFFSEASSQRFSRRRNKLHRLPRRQRSSRLLPSTTSPYHWVGGFTAGNDGASARPADQRLVCSTPSGPLRRPRPLQHRRSERRRPFLPLTKSRYLFPVTRWR